MSPVHHYYRKFFESVWLFPALLLIVLLLLTSLKISGSSIGIYHSYLNGSTKDAAVIANGPRPVRSDEWRFNTQMTIAQKNNHFQKINNHIGNGQDMSVILDVPYKSWSQVFRPHNLIFFLLPFDNAFAFKWWFMAYLLVISCYFFVLSMLPGRRLIAALLGISLLFSAFTQWWYQYITLGTLYYTFFLATAFVHLIREKERKKIIAWGVAISYLTICFVLVLYPPFQIACGIALALFVLGFALERLPTAARQELVTKSVVVGLALVVAGATTLAFIQTHADVVHSINNTVYPGKRVIKSGGYDAPHLLSGQLGGQFSRGEKAARYQIAKIGAINQSESANYLLLLPFLLLPGLYFLYKDFSKRKPTDYAMLAVNATFLFYLLWLFVPHLGILGKLTLLDKGPQNRLLIGLGVLNMFQIVLLMRRMLRDKKQPFPHSVVLGYVGLILVFEIALGIHAKHAYADFIGLPKVLALALPVPLILYALLRRRFVIASMAICAFTVFIGIGINPLYRGTSVLTKDPLSLAIRDLSSRDSGRWVSEDVYLENFAIMNGADSLSGVYAYPQLDLWKQIDQGKQSRIYNRFAHVNFDFDRQPAIHQTSLKAVGSDSFNVIVEPCGTFLRNNNVRFLITEVKLENYERCAKVIKTINYPEKAVFIYRID